MKKIIVLLFVVGISVYLLTHVFSHTRSVIDARPVATQQRVSIPVQLTIPSLHVTSAVEQVGLDSQNRMDVPKIANDVGWYNLGAKPGEVGSAVIDGHYDTPTGAPAVFYTISTLKKGDKIIVRDDKNQQYTFTVTANISYPYDQLPMQKIFAQTDTKHLNLITCSGIWDKQRKNYSSRDVIYAVAQ